MPEIRAVEREVSIKRRVPVVYQTSGYSAFLDFRATIVFNNLRGISGRLRFDSPSRHQDFLCVVNGIRVPGTALFFWQHNQTSRRTGSRIHNQTNNQTSRQNQSVPQKSQSKRFNLRRRYSEHRASKPATAAVRLSDSKMKSFAEYMDARRCGLSGRVSTLPAKRR